MGSDQQREGRLDSATRSLETVAEDGDILIYLGWDSWIERLGSHTRCDSPAQTEVAHILYAKPPRLCRPE